MKTWILAALAATTLAGAAPAKAACDPDYSGVQLNFASQTGPYIASALQMAAAKWKDKTCGTVNVVEFPWSELYPKIVTALSSGEATFDGITFPPAWAPDFTDFLTEMPAAMRGGRGLAGHRAGLSRPPHGLERQGPVAVDGRRRPHLHLSDRPLRGPEGEDRLQGQVRLRPRTAQDLEAVHGYRGVLQPAGQEPLGRRRAYRRGGQQFWFFFSHAAAYTNHPDNPGSMFFDPETMDAQINNPGWLRGLEEYIRASKLAPPNALNFSFGEVNAAMAGGQVAQSIGWGDTGVIAADPKQSKISGHVGSAVLPGSDEIYNAKTKKWDKFPEIVSTPFMAFGGWQAAVPQTTEHADAAWNFIQFLTSPEISGEATVTGGTGVNPYRISHTTNVQRWSSIFTDREAKEYLGAQADSIAAKNVALDMRLPGYFSYTEVVEIELSKALAGEEEPQKALDTIAAEWNRLTDEFGRDKQLAAYRNAMGLPAK